MPFVVVSAAFKLIFSDVRVLVKIAQGFVVKNAVLYVINRDISCLQFGVM